MSTSGDASEPHPEPDFDAYTLVDESTLRPFLIDLLQAHSLFEYDAETVVDAALFVRGESGVPSDVTRIPEWIRQIADGQIDPRGQPLVLASMPAMLTLDGSGACGPVAAKKGIDWAIDQAAEVGLAAAVVKNGRELGWPLWAVGRLAKAGLVGLCVTNVYAADLDEASSLVGLAIPQPDAAPRYFGTFETVSEASQTELAREDQQMFQEAIPILTTLLAGGRDPEHKYDAPNPAQAEHLIVAIDPNHGLGIDAIKRCLDREFPGDADEDRPQIALPDHTREQLITLAADRDLSHPFG